MKYLRLLLFWPMVVLAGDPIPASRLLTNSVYPATPWKGRVGVIGGIPDYSTQNGSTISPYTGTSATIETALAAASGTSNHVLLGAGTFNLSGNLVFDESYVELRGSVDANGVPTTIINWTAGGDRHIGFRASTFDLSSPSAFTFRSINSGATRGSTSVTLASAPTGLSIGQPMWISDTNAGSAPDEINLYGEDQYFQEVLVTGISGSVVTFTNDPLNADYYTTRPRVGYRGISNHIRRSGLRNLILTRSGTADANYIGPQGSVECWMVNVRTTNVIGSTYHVYFYGDYRFEMRKCDLQKMSTLGSSTYCIYQQLTSCWWIEDNYFHNAPNIMPMAGTHGGAFTYNYINDLPYSPAGQISQIVFMHGSHNAFNLIEGNWLTQSYNDPGGTSTNQIFLRNRMRGNDDTGPKTSNRVPMTICDGHGNFAMAGNLLGENGVHTSVLRTFSIAESQSDAVIYNLHTGITNEFLRKHNWNSVSNAVPSEETLTGGDSVAASYIHVERQPFMHYGLPLFDPAEKTRGTNSASDNLAAAYRAVNGVEPDWSTVPVHYRNKGKSVAKGFSPVF